MIKRLTFIFILAFIGNSLWQGYAQAARNSMDLTGFQKADGSISTYYGGESADIYFAAKSLLLAADAGFDISKPAGKWISWAINNQDENGLFNRYEYDRAAEGWYYSENADADDALLALWLELLYRAAPQNKMPDKWKKSIGLASARLEELFDKERGIYHISKDRPVGLLMDNVEIYAAFKWIAKIAKQKGEHDLAATYFKKANALGKNIIKTFAGSNGIYKISTQPRSEESFYPDIVARLYPIFYALPDAGAKEHNLRYKSWIREHSDEWLSTVQDYPWGLVAVMAINIHDLKTASCWQNRAEPFRYSKRWNVLEEVSLQIVKHNVADEQKIHIPCVGNSGIGNSGDSSS